MTVTRLFTIHESPVGPLVLTGDERTLTGLRFADRVTVPDDACRDDARFAEEHRQLSEYFSGERTTFEFAMSLHGNAFERRVWEALGQSHTEPRPPTASWPLAWACPRRPAPWAPRTAAIRSR